MAHGLNTNAVHTWLAGGSLKRMGDATAAAGGCVPGLAFVLVELPRPALVAIAPEPQAEIRIEIQYGGLHVTLQCAARTGAVYAAQLQALADALCAA